MATTKLPVKFLDQYLVELFGNEKVSHPILLTSISQKTKYQLRKLGINIQEELKTLRAEAQAIQDKYSEEQPAPNSEAAPVKKIPEDKQEAYNQEMAELEAMEIPFDHYDFTEKDFIDRETGDIVASNTYFNLLDKLIFEKQESTLEVKEAEVSA